MEATCYRGVRKRKWGKWVSEIREPGKKTRIWLGSFEAPEMAAAAYDVAAYALRGRDAQLNFPELVDEFPRPMSAEPDEIRSAAIEAATRMGRRTEVVVRGEAGGGGGGGVAALKRLSQGLWCEELGLESPKMWAELAEALLIAPPVVVEEEEVKEEVEPGWLWNL